MSESKWSYIAFFFIVLFVLVLCGFSNISHENYPTGDFAANGLLIQDAINSYLLTGNYSRVGFHHPGPAILYVLASGEYFFYNILGVVPSPFSGQLLAVCFYNAVWITYALKILKSIIGDLNWSFIIMMFIIILFTIGPLATGVEHTDFFTGIWMPYLYVFPFLVFTLSVVSISRNTLDSLVPLFISAGFLINGHVSFVATIGITGLGLLFYNVFINNGIKNSLIGKEALVTNTKKYIYSLLILLCFFIPLIILTISSFPGPVGKYYSFSSGGSGNSLIDAFHFIANYWGGAYVFAASLLLMIIGFLIKSNFSNKDQSILVSVLITIILSTLALMFYALVGIDDLSHSYVGLYYFVIPVLCFSFMLYFIIRSFSNKVNRKYPIILFSFAISMLIAFSGGTNSNSAGYNDNRVYEVSRTLKDNDDIRWVLDLDNINDWNIVWPQTVAVMLENKTNGIDPFCIRRGWHILFTKDSLCSANEVLNGRSFIVTTLEYQDKTPTLNWLDLNLYEVAPVSKLDNGNNFIRLSGSTLIGDGWSGPEGDFIWSDGNEATINIDVQKGFVGQAVLKLSSFPGSVGKNMSIDVLVNGTLSSNHLFDINDNNKEVIIPIDNSSNDNSTAVIKILIHDPISPFDAGISDDKRALGVKLHGLIFNEGL